MSLTYAIANEAEVPEIATLRTAVAEKLTRRHGRGHWSSAGTERGVLLGIRTSRGNAKSAFMMPIRLIRTGR